MGAQSTGISRAAGKSVLLTKGGNTGDIINVILDVIPDVKRQTKGFATGFTPTKAGMQKLWSWVRTNIRYEEDPLGVQWVREPARLWHDKVGDCKSFTVFIVSVLENIGLDYRVRFSNTEIPDSKIVNHVYPIAILPDGSEVIVDAVYPFFNAQKRFHFAKDYTMSDIYRLSGIGSAQIEEAEKYLMELQTAVADIPDDVVDSEDITAMTAGQFSRWQAAEKFDAQAGASKTPVNAAKFRAAAQAVRSGNISGIGAIAPSEARKIETFLRATATQGQKAFSAPVLVLPDSLAGNARVGSLVDAIKNAWKKIVNWIFKKAMPLAGPFFLYTFLKKSVGKKTDKKKAGQMKVLNWIQAAGKFDNKEAVIEAAKTAIIKKMGKTPEAILNDATNGQTVAGIGFLATAAVTAITFVVEIIGKISALFKKNKTDVDKNDAADFEELSDEATINAKGTNSTDKTGTGKSDTNFVPIAIAAGAALLLWANH